MSGIERGQVLALDLLLSANSAGNDELTERPARRSAKLDVTLPTYKGGNVTSNSQSRLTLYLGDSSPRRRDRGRTALLATHPPRKARTAKAGGAQRNSDYANATRARRSERRGATAVRCLAHSRRSATASAVGVKGSAITMPLGWATAAIRTPSLSATRCVPEDRRWESSWARRSRAAASEETARRRGVEELLAVVMYLWSRTTGIKSNDLSSWV